MWREETSPHESILKNKELIVRHFKDILELAGYDPDYEGFKRTPERQWEILELMSRGFDSEVTLDRMYNDFSDNLASLRICPGIEFISVCEHHFAPFFGKVDIAYVPKNSKVTGLSKLPQLVLKYALRPQIQERMEMQIADELMERCDLNGVMVNTYGRHTCELCEGYRRDDPYTTSTVKGLFMANPYLKDEALKLLAMAKEVRI